MCTFPAVLDTPVLLHMPGWALSRPVLLVSGPCTQPRGQDRPHGASSLGMFFLLLRLPPCVKVHLLLRSTGSSRSDSCLMLPTTSLDPSAWDKDSQKSFVLPCCDPETRFRKRTDSSFRKLPGAWTHP